MRPCRRGDCVRFSAEKNLRFWTTRSWDQTRKTKHLQQQTDVHPMSCHTFASDNMVHISAEGRRTDMTESSNKHKTSMQVISNAWHSNRLLAYYNPTVLLYNRKSKYVLVSTVLKLGMLIPCSINTTKVFYNLFNFSYKRIHVPCCSESSQSIFERLCRVVLQYNFWLVPNTKWSTWKKTIWFMNFVDNSILNHYNNYDHNMHY